MHKIGRLGDRFVVTWKESDGKRRRYRLNAKTHKEAEAEARGLLQKSPEKLTVEDLWESYREDKTGRRMAEHMHYSGKKVLPYFGKLKPTQVTTEDCRAYAKLRRAEGIHDGTIHTELGHLRTVLNWAHKKMRWIEFAPHIERPAQPEPKDRWLTRQEIQRLLAVDMAPHVRMAILLMLTTAGRKSAVLELTWDRVDLEAGWIKLKTDEMTTRKGRATVPINNTLREALKEAKKAALTNFVVEFAGGPVKSIRTGFDSAMKKARLEGVTPHDLRRTAAVHMVQGGVPMSEVAQYLGHSNTDVTEKVYARFSTSYLGKAASHLEF